MNMIADIEKIEAAANTADSDIRIVRRMAVGSAGHQGDVYYHALPANHPRGKLIATGKCQVALGTNMGARHVVEGELEVYEGVKLPNGVKAPMDVEATEILGPVVVAKGRWVLSHPEHAHHHICAGVVGFTYQYDPRTMRRVQD